MQFGKKSSVRTVVSLVAHYRMLAKRNRVAVANLFEPCQSVFMSGQAGDHIVVAIAIDIVGKHVGATFWRKAYRMKLPQRFVGILIRLFKPAVLGDHVQSVVAIDIAHSQSMTESWRRYFFRYLMKRPCGKRL